MRALTARQLPFTIRTVLLAMAGILLASPWVSPDCYPLTWVGMSLAYGLTRGQSTQSSFCCWLLVGVASMGTAFHWLPEVAARQLQVGGFSGFVVASLSIVWDSFRFGLFGWMIARVPSSSSFRSPLIAVIWVMLEYLWPHVFPWRLGHTQIEWLSLCQICEITGVYGVSFLLVLVSCLIADAVREASRQTYRLAIYQFLIPVLLLVAIVGWGILRIGQIEQQRTNQRELRVTVIQPGSRDNLLANLQSLSHSIDDEVNLVIWGESSIDQFSLSLKSFASKPEVQSSHRFAAEDRAPCPGLGISLLCGGGSFAVGNHEGPFRNTAYMIDADENIVGRYHKRILMPWGEYALGQQFIPGLREMLTTAESLEPGYSATPLNGPHGAKLGVLICYEDLMPEPARETVLEGAEVLINLNNLDSFGETKALQTHQMLAQFRAIECRRWLVRAGINGTSSIVSSTGETVQILRTNAPGTMTASVPMLDSVTIHTRWGDLFSKLCTTLSLISLLWSWRARKTADPKQKQPSTYSSRAVDGLHSGISNT